MIEVKFVRSDWTNRKSGYGQSGKPMASFLLRLPSRRKSNVEFMFMLRIGEGFLIRQWITAARFKLPLFPSSPFRGPSCKRWHKTKGKCEFNLELGENRYSLSCLYKQHENVLLPELPFEAGVPIKVLKISMCFSHSSQLPRHLGCLEFWLRAVTFIMAGKAVLAGNKRVSQRCCYSLRFRGESAHSVKTVLLT